MFLAVQRPLWHMFDTAEAVTGGGYEVGGDIDIVLLALVLAFGGCNSIFELCMAAGGRGAFAVSISLDECASYIPPRPRPELSKSIVVRPSRFARIVDVKTVAGEISWLYGNFTSGLAAVYCN